MPQGNDNQTVMDGFEPTQPGPVTGEPQAQQPASEGETLASPAPPPGEAGHDPTQVPAPTPDLTETTTDEDEPVMPVRVHVQDRVNWHRERDELLRKAAEYEEYRRLNDPLISRIQDRLPEIQKTYEEHARFQAELQDAKLTVEYLKSLAAQNNVPFDEAAARAAIDQRRAVEQTRNLPTLIKQAVAEAVAGTQEQHQRQVREAQEAEARRRDAAAREQRFASEWTEMVKGNPSLASFETLVRGQFDALQGAKTPRAIADEVFAGLEFYKRQQAQAVAKAAALTKTMPTTVRGSGAKPTTGASTVDAEKLGRMTIRQRYQYEQSLRGA